MKSNPHPFSGILVRFEHKKPPSAGDVSLTEVADGNELHVNLWDFDTQAILDIGLMIHSNEDFENILIDVPWRLKRENIFDLASEIDGERYLSAIFNRQVNYTSAATVNGAGCPSVSFPGESGKNFSLVRLNGTAYKVEHPPLQSSNEITRIKIANPKTIFPTLANNAGRYYLRFRLLGVPEEAFATLFIQKDQNLLSSCTQAKVVDFRINTRRGVPDEVLSPVDAHLEFPNFDRIHLFLIMHREREFSLPGQTYKACRSLEDESVWNDYIRLDGEFHDHHVEEVKNYLGYQWTTGKEKDKPVNELVALAKFNRVVSGKWIRTRFVLIAILLGASSNGLWEYALAYEGSYPKLPTNHHTIVTVGMLLAISLVIYSIPDWVVKRISKLKKTILKRIFRKLC